MVWVFQAGKIFQGKEDLYGLALVAGWEHYDLRYDLL